MSKKILLLSGGGGSEHKISKISASYLEECVLKKGHTLLHLDFHPPGIFKDDKSQKFYNIQGNTFYSNQDEAFSPDYILPCFHGYPGETGEIPSLCNLLGIPYFGCDPLASLLTCDKSITKVYAEKFEVPTVPFITLHNESYSKQEVENFFNSSGSDVFIKATQQGSSIGCYPVKQKNELHTKIGEAFKLSSKVLVEKSVHGREIEIAVFEYKNKLHISEPGEILCPNKFYSYDEKYSEKSATKTQIPAQLPRPLLDQLQVLSQKIFTIFQLRDLSRLDFFIENEKVYLNEIQTFPGMTSISLFPKMVENEDIKFEDFLEDRINSRT